MNLNDFFKELDDIHGRVIDIVINRSLDYIDDLDMLDSDINSDLENEVFDEMSENELKEYIANARKILEFYEGEMNNG